MSSDGMTSWHSSDGQWEVNLHVESREIVAAPHGNGHFPPSIGDFLWFSQLATSRNLHWVGWFSRNFPGSHVWCSTGSGFHVMKFTRVWPQWCGDLRILPIIGQLLYHWLAWVPEEPQGHGGCLRLLSRESWESRVRSVHPLVMTNSLRTWTWHLYSGFSHWTWWFSIVISIIWQRSPRGPEDV